MIIAPTTTHTTQSMALSCPRSDLRSSQEPDVATEVREAFRRRACLLKIGLGAGIAIVFLVFPLSQASRHRSPTNALPARSPSRCNVLSTEPVGTSAASRVDEKRPLRGNLGEGPTGR